MSHNQNLWLSPLSVLYEHLLPQLQGLFHIHNAHSGIHSALVSGISVLRTISSLNFGAWRLVNPKYFAIAPSISKKPCG